MKKHDLPAMPFYPGDWLKCPEVRALPLDYRMLWFELLCFMWESTERGVMIKPDGKPYSDQEIVRMVGVDNQNSGLWLTTMVNQGVCSRREDGAIFSRRMVRDEEKRQKMREIGKKGGNPSLMVNHTVNHGGYPCAENENEIKASLEAVPRKLIDKRSAFKPPTADEVKSYCNERKNRVDPQAFVDFYESKGWMIGKNKMKSWQAAVRTWEKSKVVSVKEEPKVTRGHQPYNPDWMNQSHEQTEEVSKLIKETMRNL